MAKLHQLDGKSLLSKETVNKFDATLNSARIGEYHESTVFEYATNGLELTVKPKSVFIDGRQQFFAGGKLTIAPNSSTWVLLHPLERYSDTLVLQAVTSFAFDNYSQLAIAKVVTNSTSITAVDAISHNGNVFDPYGLPNNQVLISTPDAYSWGSVNSSFTSLSNSVTSLESRIQGL